MDSTADFGGAVSILAFLFILVYTQKKMYSDQCTLRRAWVRVCTVRGVEHSRVHDREHSQASGAPCTLRVLHLTPPAVNPPYNPNPINPSRACFIQRPPAARVTLRP